MYLPALSGIYFSFFQDQNEDINNVCGGALSSLETSKIVICFYTLLRKVYMCMWYFYVHMCPYNLV